jgi:hypothetical protein
VRRSLYNNTRAVQALAVATRATAATVNGNTVDLNLDKQNFRNALVVIHTGTITDGSHAVAVQESDDAATWTDAPAESLSGALPTMGAADSDSVFEIGYLGSRRYVRVAATTSGATSGGTFGAMALLGQPNVTPVPRP